MQVLSATEALEREDADATAVDGITAEKNEAAAQLRAFAEQAQVVHSKSVSVVKEAAAAKDELVDEQSRAIDVVHQAEIAAADELTMLAAANEKCVKSEKSLKGVMKSGKAWVERMEKNLAMANFEAQNALAASNAANEDVVAGQVSQPP